MQYDVAIVGAGLAGLVAACELIDAKKKVLLVDQEPENSIGGQAYWSFGGIFLVNSPEQRRLGIK
ncbi:MAG TPA: FAD-binding dehydrogenase, partial [Lysinibacillus sp.]|nr:FAD-binding dehydrogenase [Lysinibacillus sp.]